MSFDKLVWAKTCLGHVGWLQNTLRIDRNMFSEHLTLPNIGNSIFDFQTLSTRICPQKLPLRPGVSQLTFGSWILASGSRILDSGSWIFDSGSWIFDFGLWIFDYGLWIVNSLLWIMMDDYDWWLWLMIMIYDDDWWLWLMIDDYDSWLWLMIMI